jgi:NADPH-ferrihemoprotein reductase
MEKTIDTFGIMDIYYGSTSGNSKRLAYDFSVEAKSKGFLPRVICLGDFQPDQLMTSKLMFMFLSTYGTGGPTEDS